MSKQEPQSPHAAAAMGTSMGARNKRTEDAMLQEVTGDSSSKRTKRQRTANVIQTETAAEIGPASNVPLFNNHMQFPNQLWELLKYDELKDAIWWMSGNDAFAINEISFSAKLLESHFRGNKFSSIIRKLNRWGFRKYVDRSLPPKTVAYYHRSFQKGRPELLKLIEKEEGKLPPNAQGPAFSLFPQATTSHRITHVLQAASASPHHAAPAFLPAARNLALTQNPGRSLSSLAHLTLARSPLNLGHPSSILPIFGQRGAAAAVTDANTSPSSLAAGVGVSSNIPMTSTTTSRTRELLRRSNLQISIQTNEGLEPQALLATMVRNIERERHQQRQEQEGRLLLALERERSRLVVQEQKEEAHSEEPSLFALMGSRRQQPSSGIRDRHHQLQLRQQQLEQQRQQDQDHQILTAACRRDEENLQAVRADQRQQQHHFRDEFNSQLQLRGQFRAAISSPNPFRSPLQTGLTRSVLRGDSQALPVADLLLSPQQRARQQVLQLQEHQHRQLLRLGEEELNRRVTDLPGPGHDTP